MTDLISLYLNDLEECDGDQQRAHVEQAWRRAIAETLRDRGHKLRLPQTARILTRFGQDRSMVRRNRYAPYWAKLSRADLIALLDHMAS